MPLTKSAIKRARQSLVRKERRRPYKTQMKTLIKKVTEAAQTSTAEAAKLLPQVYKAIDMAAKKGIIHPSNAARKKSAMAKMAAKK
jgi:small subunit ribosomal protein S20